MRVVGNKDEIMDRLTGAEKQTTGRIWGRREGMIEEVGEMKRSREG